MAYLGQQERRGILWHVLVCDVCGEEILISVYEQEAKGIETRETPDICKPCRAEIAVQRRRGKVRAWLTHETDAGLGAKKGAS